MEYHFQYVSNMLTYENTNVHIKIEAGSGYFKLVLNLNNIDRKSWNELKFALEHQAEYCLREKLPDDYFVIFPIGRKICFCTGIYTEKNMGDRVTFSVYDDQEVRTSLIKLCDEIIRLR